MMYLDAWEVMSRHSLVSRKVSKEILRYIVEGETPPADLLPQPVTPDDVDHIRERYREKLDQIGGRVPDGQPRNLPFYLIIRDMVPGFSWTVAEQPNVRAIFDVSFNCPYVEKVRPSLMSLLLNLVKPEASTDLHRRYDCIYRLPTKVSEKVVELLSSVNLVRPGEAELNRVVDWIERGLAGERLTVVSPICPDYEAHHLGANIYRYSFNNLGCGVGVVAKRLLDALPAFDHILGDLGLDVRYIVAIGDFEAYSAETCDRVGLTEAEFTNRLRESQANFKRTCSIDVETPLFTELAGGKQSWLETKDRIYRQMTQGDFGHTGLTDDDVKAIACSRKGLYSRWYGKDHDRSFLDILTAQGAEYCAMGEIVASGVENGLVLGADHSRMAPFYNFHRPLPVLYIRNNYLGVT